MATAYSDDLRRKLLEAHQRKEGSLSRLAERFCVSRGWALKISSQLHRTGKMERTAGRRRGPASKITAEIQQELKDWIAKQADLTLAELQLRLYEQRKLEISLSRLWTVLKGLGLRLKKSHSMPPSKIPKRGVFNARTGAKPAKRSTRRT
jgi:transposase